LQFISTTISCYDTHSFFKEMKRWKMPTNISSTGFCIGCSLILWQLGYFTQMHEGSI
jgi:uncharacterized membrane protein AbrB (regulator of aidB expression)